MTSEHIGPKKGYKGRSNTDFNACGTRASSDVPTYNIRHPIQIDIYIILIAKYLL